MARQIVDLQSTIHQTTVQASTYVSLWVGVLIADVKLGRFKTILIFSFTYLAVLLLGISIACNYI